jgi:hypothetical protein
LEISGFTKKEEMATFRLKIQVGQGFSYLDLDLMSKKSDYYLSQQKLLFEAIRYN